MRTWTSAHVWSWSSLLAERRASSTPPLGAWSLMSASGSRQAAEAISAASRGPRPCCATASGQRALLKEARHDVHVGGQGTGASRKHMCLVHSCPLPRDRLQCTHTQVNCSCGNSQEELPPPPPPPSLPPHDDFSSQRGLPKVVQQIAPVAHGAALRELSQFFASGAPPFRVYLDTTCMDAMSAAWEDGWSTGDVGGPVGRLRGGVPRDAPSREHILERS